MRSSLSASTALHAAGLALLSLLAACGDGAILPASRALQAEPLEASYRQLIRAVEAAGNGCTEAPILAVALDGWRQAVVVAGFQSRFAGEVAEASRHTTAIRARCPAAATAMADDDGTRHGATATPSSERRRDTQAQRALTPDLVDAYARGIDKEIALMRASGTHFVSLSRYGGRGPQVAAAAGLSLPEYKELRKTMQKVLYALMLHDRYAGADGEARLAVLEPHKREHAEDVLARDPYAALSIAERDAVQSRLGTLQAQHHRYMDLAAIAD